MTKAVLRKSVAALALGAACFLSFASAGAEKLQLDSVIRAALDHGQKIPHSDIKLKLAEARLQQAQGAFDWRANARAGWTRLYYPRTRTIGGVRVLTDDLDNSSAVQVTAGVSRLFRNGIQIQPGITYYPNTSASRAQTFGLTRPQPTINLQIPLLHAFDEDNPAAAAERAALDDVIGTKFERSAAQQQAVLDAVQTYWRCLAAQEEGRILGDNQAASQAYLASLRKLMGAGQIASAVLDRALAKQALKEADLAKVRELERLCRTDLAVLLDLHSELALPTIAGAFPDLYGLLETAEKLTDTMLVDVAYKNRPDVRALEQYVAAADERLVGAQTGLDPKVDLSVNPDGAFVTVSKSLESNTEEGLVAEADANASEARLSLIELRQQIRRDVSRGIGALRDSLSTLIALRRSDQALDKVVEDSRRSAQLGGSEGDELRILEGERADIAVQLAEAELDAALNLASLRLVTGTINADGSTAAIENAVLFRSLHFQ